MCSFHFAIRQNPRFYMTKGSVLRDGKDGFRISRTTLKEAQAALLEYLHSTRSIQFIHAENMSKNSPHFLRKLLEKVEIVTDARRSVSRFLRYHPINEFEPFFESLGLKHWEYTPLLPRDMMFLSDDCLLLENYRALCEFGLQAYLELGLSQSFMVKIIVCSPHVLIGDVDMKFIKVLEILKSTGFDYVWIEEHLSEKESYNWSMIFHVLSFFREICCSSKLHRVRPLPDSGEDIESQKLKMKFLLDLGYGENPDMMKKAFKVFNGRGGELQERFDSIVNAGLEKEDVSEMVRVSPQILNQSKDVIQSKIDILVNELGFPLSSLISFPSYLAYMTQRVRLRWAVYNWLKDQEIVPDLALSTLVSCSEKFFLSRCYRCCLRIHDFGSPSLHSYIETRAVSFNYH
ncbi:Mitochondrial transcription termination factor family protein [Hibiscus syriacus]|uniref:Mitochondrial transcription termination factor family protein n=1 Tax=Hibiscus syriacus TaxID=106335 RepID=A0A6A2Y0W2_HIBSY|nr:Mitochondrial transcription termination factor family protein [Hibiscus syriacus]